jgi:AraC-like DNA-binding protein
LILIVNGKEFLVEKNMIYLQRPNANIIYRTGPAGYCHKRFVAIVGPLVEPFLEQLRLSSFDTAPVKNPKAISRMLAQAYRLIMNYSPMEAMELSIMALRIMLFTCLDISMTPLQPAVHAVLSYMQRNIGATVAVSELAAVAGMSVSQFYRLFHQYQHTPPMQYFNNLKMQLAASYLAYASSSIKDIARSLGFEEVAYFSNQFKKIMGISPREYRKRKVEVKVEVEV